MLTVTLKSDSSDEEFKTVMELTKFRVAVYSGKKLMLLINPDDTLLVENVEYFHNKDTIEDFDALLSQENTVNQVCEAINSHFIA